MNAFKIATIVALTSLLGACSTMDRLSQVGQAPPLTAIQDPTTTAGYQPVSMPMPQAIEDTYLPNSLYRTSAKGFFKDQRAHRVGDILTVLVTIDDQAQISNQTARGRTSTRRLRCPASSSGGSAMTVTLFAADSPRCGAKVNVWSKTTRRGLVAQNSTASSSAAAAR